MITNSKSILSMRFRHEFFLDGIWRGLSCSPSRESQLALNRHKVKFVPTETGFFFFRVLPEYLEGLQIPGEDGSQIRIRILLNSNDPLLLNYSALPLFDLRREALYLSNRSATDGSLKSTLTDGPYASEKDVVRVYPPVFTWSSGMEQVQELVVVDDFGQEVLRTQTDESGRATLYLDEQPQARYALRVEGKEPELFVVHDQAEGKGLAILDLYLLPQAIREKDPKEQAFELAISARSVYWEYVVQMGSRSMEGKEISIVDPEKEVRFAPAEEVLTGDGKALRIITSDPVQLHDRYNYAFELFQSPGDKLLADRLPVPDNNYMLKYPGRDDEYIAQVYFYLNGR